MRSTPRWWCACITATPSSMTHLWRYAADFKTGAGKQLGLKLERRGPGLGDLEVFFDPAVSTGEKILFSKYIHEHLQQQARDVERLRHYVCEDCGTPVGNRDLAMTRLNAWLQGRPPEPERRAGSNSSRARTSRRRSSARTAKSGCSSGMTWSSSSPAPRFSSACATCRRRPPSCSATRARSGCWWARSFPPSRWRTRSAGNSV